MDTSLEEAFWVSVWAGFSKRKAFCSHVGDLVTKCQEYSRGEMDRGRERISEGR